MAALPRAAGHSKHGEGFSAGFARALRATARQLHTTCPFHVPFTSTRHLGEDGGGGLVGLVDA